LCAHKFVKPNNIPAEVITPPKAQVIFLAVIASGSDIVISFIPKDAWNKSDTPTMIINQETNSPNSSLVFLYLFSFLDI
jgi:hypothetical protein